MLKRWEKMTWVDASKELPPERVCVLVIKTYLNGNYWSPTDDPRKNWWMLPSIQVDHRNLGDWSGGGKILYWMDLPTMPEGIDKLIDEMNKKLGRND